MHDRRFETEMNADPPAPAAPILEPSHSAPVTMLSRPSYSAAGSQPAGEKHFAGEMREDFEAALTMVEFAPKDHGGKCLRAVKRAGTALAGIFSSRSKAWLKADRERRFVPIERKVAFDGYTTDLHDEKVERDRRYGTVYTITEQLNAYLVRLEMPRRVPASALGQVWNLPEQMPDYDYNISLSDGILTIRASVPDQVLRRVSYVSPAFPSDFLTRIDFTEPVSRFKHRLRNKVLEVIVFKNSHP
jgi:hypothetical protein